jgi:hypothetical protein
MKILNYKTSLIIISLIFSSIAFPQEDGNSKPCTMPEARQFDFWIGKWKGEWKNPDGSKAEGKNIINQALGGCVIEENFDGNPGNDLVGKSFSVYNPRKNLWQQTWVDNYGSYLVFTGGYEEDKMTLVREVVNPEGKKIMQRMIFYNIDENSFDWNWEKSTDEGKNWELSWKIHYTRIE